MSAARWLALAVIVGFTAASAPATVSITIVATDGAQSFAPNPGAAAIGDSLVWRNNDFAIHRIVMDDGSLDTGNIFPGASSAPMTLTAGGTYHCAIHPTMVGTIDVLTCAFTLAPASASVPFTASSGSVTVSAAAGCAWTAVSGSGFITVTSGASGTGNGTVTYSVAANTSTSARSGSITIAGQTFTISQSGAAVTCPVITLAPASMPAATLGVPITVNVTATGGSAPYTFSVTSGSLPAGLSLSAGGVLSGTPTVTGTSSFTVRATDAATCSVDVAYTMIVAPAVPLLPGWILLLLAVSLIGAGWYRLSRA